MTFTYNKGFYYKQKNGLVSIRNAFSRDEPVFKWATTANLLASVAVSHSGKSKRINYSKKFIQANHPNEIPIDCPFLYLWWFSGSHFVIVSFGVFSSVPFFLFVAFCFVSCLLLAAVQKFWLRRSLRFYSNCCSVQQLSTQKDSKVTVKWLKNDWKMTRLIDLSLSSAEH